MKIQLLGNYTLDFIYSEMKLQIKNEQLDYDLYIGGYNQYIQEIIDQDSQIYQTKPELIFISLLLNKIIEKELNSIEPISNWDEITNLLDESFSIIGLLAERLPSSVIFVDNFFFLDSSLSATLDYNVKFSKAEIEHYCNSYLIAFINEKKNIKVVDVQHLIMQTGKDNVIDYRMYYSAKSHWSLLGLKKISSLYMKYIKAYTGNRKKCIVLDLDNTLWGGVIGEDGINGIILSNDGIGKSFYDFQLELKRLHSMGVILAINSKNTELIALEAINSHPYMILRSEDFLIRKINWQNKAENIQAIADEINIGLNSMVFLDDSAREREIVKNNFPEVEVPELPSEPALYPTFLRNLDYFNFLNVTHDDKKRNASYNANFKRKNDKDKFTDITQFYYSLKMLADIKKADEFVVPRVAQLTQKTNQYNFRTIRYTNNDITNFVNENKYDVFTLQLEDKHGDHGIVGCTITSIDSSNKSIFVDTFILSCRVIGLTAETALFNSIYHYYKKRNFNKIIGEIIPTKKNVPCRTFYETHGFYKENGLWSIDLSNYKPKNIDWIKFKVNSLGDIE